MECDATCRALTHHLNVYKSIAITALCVISGHQVVACDVISTDPTTIVHQCPHRKPASKSASLG